MSCVVFWCGVFLRGLNYCMLLLYVVQYSTVPWYSNSKYLSSSGGGGDDSLVVVALRCVALRLALAFAKASDEKQANGERCLTLLYVVILSV